MLTEPALTPAQRDDLRAVAAMIVPESAEYKVPGADDPKIQADILATLGRDTTYWASGIYLFVVGVGSGMFNSPNTAAMMGTVAAHRRGIAAAARVLVQNTGAVISIAFVLAVVTSSVPKTVLFAVFSGLANHISNAELVPFIANMHTALWCLSGVSVIGAFVAAARPRHAEDTAVDGARTRAEIEAAA